MSFLACAVHSWPTCLWPRRGKSRPPFLGLARLAVRFAALGTPSALPPQARDHRWVSSSFRLAVTWQAARTLGQTESGIDGMCRSMSAPPAFFFEVIQWLTTMLK
jgi:hypothetical protein